MKVLVPAFFVICALGCSGGDTKSASDTHTVADAMSSIPGDAGKSDNLAQEKKDSGMPAEKEKFGDDVFKIPPYPGSEKVQYTSIEMDSDMGHTYARHYTTPDDLDKVEAFIKSEGEKVGKFKSVGGEVFNSKMIRNGTVEFSDGSRFVYKLMRPKDATDIMYNFSTPKKKS